MRKYLVLALMLLITPFAYAEEVDDKAREENKIVPAVIDRPEPVETEMKLAPVVIEERSEADAAVVQDMPRRGSFWWLVGVIVVAGVILAVVL